MTIPDSRSREWSTGPQWGYQLRNLLILVAITASVWSSVDRPLRWSTLLLLAGCVAGWLIGRVWPNSPLRLQVWAWIVVGLCGVVLAVLHPQSAALAFPAVIAVTVGNRLPLRWSVSLAMTLVVSYLVGIVLAGRSVQWYWAGPAAIIVALLFGLFRRQRDQLADETQLTREEQARTELLAERARLAREIHDVLAHSLAALTVQLETADALLENNRTEQARQSVVRASQLAREGLAETRRAIGALRGETLPMPELLDALVREYRADMDADARVEITGPARTLNADTSLALYRTAQEAMTNVRKHAPGAPVTVALAYQPTEVTLRVTNGPNPDAQPHPLADAGGGYGLTGLRERAELAGGSFSSGPNGSNGEGWHVDVRIPA